MNCENKQTEFTQSFNSIKDQIQVEINEVTNQTKEKAKTISDKTDNDNNLAQGVGMAAGTAIGGYFGGPAGAVAGASVGKQIGNLFEIEVFNNEIKIALDLPQITMKDEKIVLDLPEITMRNDDIVYTTLDIVMVDRVIGQNPVLVCEAPTWDHPVPSCKVRMEDIIISVPETRPRDVRITLSVPELVMKPQNIVLSIPKITMETQELKFNVPSITIKSKKDIAKQLSDEATALVSESQSLVKNKKEIIKAKIQLEVLPKATAMFDCFREGIIFEKNNVSNAFEPSIHTVNESLKNMAIQNVPDTDDDYIKLKSQFDDLVAKRDLALKNFDDALLQLETDKHKSLDSLINI